jgi:ankyrin repeat protein
LQTCDTAGCKPALRACGALLLFIATVVSSSGQGTPSPQTFRDPRAVELKAAILSSNVSAVRQLTEAASSNDCLEVDDQGRTALHYAVRVCASGTSGASAFEVLKLLAGRPGCVDAADRLGRKPILELGPLSWGNRSKMDALTSLVANGADVNAQDQNGNTLLHQLLRTWDAAAVHWPDVLQILLRGHVDPNITNAQGQTALHLFFGANGFCTNRDDVPLTTRVKAAQKVFTMLLSAGAAVSIKDRDGTTPIGTLLLQDEPDYGTKETILGFLDPSLAKQLPTGTAEIKGRPALVYLCDHGQADVDLLERLLQLGADPKHGEADGFTALHGAAWFYDYRVCDLLLNHGADVNSVNHKGRAPLHELARSTYWKSAFFDADKGADILKAADVLVGHGADRRRKDASGKTAYDLLKGNGPATSDDPDLARQLKKKLR